MQSHPALKIVVASALGAFIGSLVGLQFTPSLWWIGMIVGGLVGYVSYEFGTIVRAIPVAATQARYLVNRAQNVNYPQIGKALRGLGIAIAYGVGVIIVMAAFCVSAGLMWTLPITGLVALDHPFNLLANIRHLLVWTCFAGILMWTGTLSVIQELGMSYLSNRQLYAIVYFKATPFGILFYWLPRGIWALIRGLIWTINFLVKAIVFVAFLASKLFTLVHTDRRLLCAIDAALGAGAGMLTHNPLVGAIAGGLIGLIDYELVSKRLLKVESTQS